MEQMFLLVMISLVMISNVMELQEKKFMVTWHLAASDIFTTFINFNF